MARRFQLVGGQDLDRHASHRSHRGTQFRQWATARLEEYLVEGFTLDDERLKRAGGGNYFEEVAGPHPGHLLGKRQEVQGVLPGVS